MFRFLMRFIDTLAAKDAELAAERAARAFLAQRLAELKLEHEKETAEWRRRLAVQTASFEWLTVSHNTLSAERAQLMLARTGISVPAPEIQIQASAEGRSVTEQQMRENRLPTVADLAAQGLSFDDVGERQARALGLDDGEVYGGPSILVS